MEKHQENGLEKFIQQNRNEFDVDCCPHENHEETFLFKLKTRIKQFISIVPYLIRVIIVTIIVFTVSIILWDNYIRKDRHEITLKQKAHNTTTIVKKIHETHSKNRKNKTTKKGVSLLEKKMVFNMQCTS